MRARRRVVAASARRRSSSRRALSPRSGVSEAYQAVTCALKAHRVAVNHVDRARLTGGGSQYLNFGLLNCDWSAGFEKRTGDGFAK